MNFVERIEQVRAEFSELGIAGGFLPVHTGDYEYLTGNKRKRPNARATHGYGDWIEGIFFNQTEMICVAPNMHKRFLMQQCEGKAFINEFFILEEGRNLYDYAKQILERMGLANQTIAVPKATLGKTLYVIQDLFPGTKFYGLENIVAPMRMIKSEQELVKMEEAALLTDKIFMDLVSNIKVGMTEVEIARDLEYLMLYYGAEGTSFNSGVQLTPENKDKNFIDTSNRFSKAQVEKGCSLAFDFGIILDGYCSDFGRTIYIGEPSEKRVHCHKVVMDSQKAAISAMKPGITAGDLDKVARNFIRDAGYVNNEFFHRLGHGIGIDVHEYPFLNDGYDEPLQNNMTFTIEPSLLFDNIWTRVEDVVVVTPNGGVSLNKAPGVDDLIVIEA